MHCALGHRRTVHHRNQNARPDRKQELGHGLALGWRAPEHQRGLVECNDARHLYRVGKGTAEHNTERLVYVYVCFTVPNLVPPACEAQAA